jgi:multidrug efflux system membrane fusion protein
MFEPVENNARRRRSAAHGGRRIAAKRTHSHAILPAETPLGSVSGCVFESECVFDNVKCEEVSNDPIEPEPSASPRGPTAFMRKHWVALLVIIVALALMIGLFAYLRHKQSPPAGGPGRGRQSDPVAVSVATAASGDIQLRIPALGTVTPLATVTVKTQINGVMQKILFTEGQTVHQGDSLAQIDPRPYEAALQQMQGNLRRDRALLTDAKLNLQRYEGLVKEDSIAQQQLDTQRALVDQYIGAIESDEGQVKTASVNLVYTRIIAPVTGRVGLRQVDQGNYVTPGDANGIVVINQVQPITVIFSIPEDNVSALMQRLHNGTALPVEAYDRTNSTKLADGKLFSVDNEIDTTTGTIKLRAQFDNADSLLFPNQFVNIQLLQELLRNQVVIPNSAVRRGAPNGVVSTFVYVVNSDRTVTVRAVTLGVVDGERVAVAKGLGAGEIVVTEGGDRLRDGAPVQLPGAAAPGSSAKGPASAAHPPGSARPGAADAPRSPGQHRPRQTKPSQ